MAIKTLVARKRRDSAAAELRACKDKLDKLRDDEAELEARIDGAAEIDASIEEEIEALNEAKDEAEKAAKAAQDILDAAEEALAAAEAEQEAMLPPVSESDTETRGAEMPEKTERRNATMTDMKIRSRSGCFETRAQREDFFERSDVKEWLGAVRAAGQNGMQTRAVNNTSVLIPEIVLEMLRNNIEQYSRLLKYCTVRRLSGTGRQPLSPVIPEAVWMEMAGALNELDLTFNEIEFDGYMVGGYFKVANSVLADSDINLGEELLWNLLQAVGKALDRAIVYGAGPSSHQPVGFVTRLAASSQPAWWGSKQGDFTDLHSTNIITLNIQSSTGVSFFQPLIAALGKAAPDYSDGKLVWVMNRKAHMDIISKAMAFDAAGALVSQTRGEMPVIGGVIVEEEFMADYEIAGGFMSLQIMAEREGSAVDSSDQQFFVQNQTAFKGYARYDGKTAKGEGFVLVNYNNTSPTTASTFAKDYANTKINTLIVTAAAGTATGDTVLTVSGSKEDTPTLKYSKQDTTAGIKTGDKVGSEYKALTSGTTQITATAGTPIAVVELDSAGRVVSAGNVIAVPKT